MKKISQIHNMDSLEREIYRLELQAKDIERKLDHNLDRLQQNYVSMTMNSFFKDEKRDEDKRNGFWKSLLANQAFTAAMHSIAGNIANRAAGELNEWMNKTFKRKEDK